MKTIEVPEKDLEDLKKTLRWVKDNPGCHPENIRKEILRLHKIFIPES